LAKAKRRRDNGAGTISKRPDGRYMGQISIVVNGRRKRPTVYGWTKKEVMEKMNTLKNQKQTGTYIEPVRITVAQWMNGWLENYVKINLEQKSYDKMESMSRIHVIPGIGQVLLQRLTSSHIQALYSEKMNPTDGSRALASSSVRQLHILIHSALEQAVEEGILSRNPADAARPPKQKNKEGRPLSREQVKIFLTTAENEPCYAAFVVAFGTGLRCGELLGLRWKDVNFKAKVITVNQSAVVTAKAGILLKAPKTAKGRRTVLLPEEAIKELKKHRLAQAKSRLRWGEAYHDNDLVFPNDDGSPMNQRKINYSFHRILKKAGLPLIRFHDIRHTHATLLLQAGENMRVVADRLGHAAVGTTLKTYTHIMPGMQEGAAAKIDAILTNKDEC